MPGPFLYPSSVPSDPVIAGRFAEHLPLKPDSEKEHELAGQLARSGVGVASTEGVYYDTAILDQQGRCWTEANS